MHQRDLLCVMVDSFDKSKLCLPRYPYGRCPKRAVYEAFGRNLSQFGLLVFIFADSRVQLYIHEFVKENIG